MHRHQRGITTPRAHNPRTRAYWNNARYTFIGILSYSSPIASSEPLNVFAYLLGSANNQQQKSAAAREAARAAKVSAPSPGRLRLLGMGSRKTAGRRTSSQLV